MSKILLAVAGCIFCWNELAYAVPLTGLTGLDQADLVAGDHGQQGRDNARLHQTSLSPETGIFTNPALTKTNSSFTTQGVGLPPAEIPGSTFVSPATVPSGDPLQATPEVGLPSSAIHGMTFVSPTTAQGADPPQATPEPISLLLLGSGLVGLGLLRLRKS